MLKWSRILLYSWLLIRNVGNLVQIQVGVEHKKAVIPSPVSFLIYKSRSLDYKKIKKYKIINIIVFSSILQLF